MDFAAFSANEQAVYAVNHALLILSEAAAKLGEQAEHLCPQIVWADIRGLGTASVTTVMRHENRSAKLRSKMGREKDRMIEEEDRGWYSVSRDLVCESCVNDEFLSQYVSENGSHGVCDYCGDDSEDTGLACVPFDDLMDLIGDGINWAYNSADDEGQPTSLLKAATFLKIASSIPTIL